MRGRLITVFAGALVLCASTAIAALSISRSGASGSREACLGTDSAQVAIPAGAFDIGSENFYPEEGPVFRLSVAAFDIDIHEVTNRQFRTFIEATGYVTSAERTSETGFAADGSAVFNNFMNWSFVKGADWRHPEGPGSSIRGEDDSPVVQVSLADAHAYAEWAGRRLPTEVEWEFAARGGLEGKTYAWGDSFTPGGEYMANTWQGIFPVIDTGEDGHKGKSPVGCYEPNGYGLYDMIGNVWEWTQDPYYPDKRFSAPEGVESTGFDPTQPETPVGVIKGGSFLCSPDYCGRFRPAARHAQFTGLGTNHIGFRTVAR